MRLILYFRGFYITNNSYHLKVAVAWWSVLWSCIPEVEGLSPGFKSFMQVCTLWHLQKMAAEWKLIWSPSLCLPPLLLFIFRTVGSDPAVPQQLPGSFGSQMKTCCIESMHIHNTRVVVSVVLSLSDLPTGLHWSAVNMLCSRVSVWSCLQEGIWMTQSTFSLDPTKQINCFLPLVYFCHETKWTHALETV